MSIEPASDDALYRLAGLTGIGWITSLLASLGRSVGVGDHYLAGLAVHPHLLLYAGVVLFAVTIAIERLRASAITREP
jgi:hypothetical protein